MPRFRAKPIELEAFQLRTVVEIPSGRGRPAQKGTPGDWLVTHPDHRQEILTDAALQAGYELVHENGAPPLKRGGGGPGKPSGRRRPSPRATRPHAAGTKTARGGKADLALMQRLYEGGQSVSEITRQVKVSAAAVYYHASTKKWKRPAKAKGTTAPPAAAPAKAGSEKLKGRTRCHACAQMTEWDPCQYCGKALKRAWS